MNTNISSLQTIVSAIQKNDQVSAIAPISKNGEEIGYSISFTSGKTIIIYHGTDGKDGADGQNGKDGVDGHTPIIGVKQDADGVYYWTLDGEWLLDNNGNKIKAVGTDGKDGENGEDGVDGTDGKDGQDGANGADGITPQLKIENDYWYISYDNGNTWKQLGKAVGEDGADGKDGVNGTNGVDGKDGDSFFQSVTQDDDNVYFTLVDGTVITIPKVSNIELSYVPRYSDGKATVFYNSSKSDSYVEFDFEVSPANKVADWSEFATIKAVYTQTRAASGFVEMEIVEWVVDAENGVITVKASGENLSDSFFNGSNGASARLVIHLGDIDISSNYIPMVVEQLVIQPNNEIWYTTTDGNIVTPQNSPALISNTYNNGKGVMAFYNDITEIEYRAFYYNNNLASISLPNSVVTINVSAFEGCENLNNITMSNNVAEIGAYALYQCANLPEITIPNSVVGFGFLALSRCSSLESFYGKYASFDGRCIVIDNVLTFFAPAGLYSYVIPDDVAKISKTAFYNCNNLVNITIPSCVEEVDTYAFESCSSLQKVYCESKTPPMAGSLMFYKTNDNLKIYVPVGSGAAYKAAEGWSTYASIIEEKEM